MGNKMNIEPFFIVLTAGIIEIIAFIIITKVKITINKHKFQVQIGTK